MFDTDLSLAMADLGGAFIWALVLAIPIVSIVGGIVAAIVRTSGRHRLIELAQRERIAAIERGIDPAKLPPLPLSLPPEIEGERSPRSLADEAGRRAQGLMIGGIITLAIGLSVGALMVIIEPGKESWAVGIVPSAVGIALLVCASIVRPRRGEVE